MIIDGSQSQNIEYFTVQIKSLIHQLTRYEN